MIKKNSLSLRLRTAFELWLCSVVLFSLLRGAFFLTFYKGADHFASSETVTAFWLGLRFDLRLAMLLILPILLLGFAKNPVRWDRSARSCRIWSIAYGALYALVICVYAFDFGYYSYLQSRINVSIFQFLRNPLISAQMMYESYNLFLWVPVVLLAVFGLYLFFSRRLFAAPNTTVPTAPAHQRSTLITQGVLVTLIILASLWGSASQYPLRWSEAFFSQNMFIAYLSMNPVHYLVDSSESRKQTYDLDKVKEHYEKMARYLGVTDVHDLNFKRPVDETPQFKSPNIVYIVMESMAAYKTGVFKNAPDSSPSLDRLANEGWLFRNYYTPTEGTARSLFCVLTGIPDINAKSTSSRNPLIVNQNTLINALEGYEKFYFIGGSASWGNIRGVYMNNVNGLKMYEGDTNLGGPRTDVWGLSDLDLFRQTAKVLKERDQSKPFFALIQSASFHRPYTIPPEHGDFKLKTLSPQELETLGFASNEEYNSFRLADYSLGEFFNLIKDSEFFKNTIFVIHGDHGLPHNGAHNLADGYKFYGLNRFHVPLVFYSPLFKEHKEFNFMMSETDVWPTLIGLTGRSFTNAALGRNVFAIPADQHHYAFSYVYYSDPLQIMLYDQDFIAFGTEKHIDGLYKYMTPEFKQDVSSQYPEKFKEMSDLLMGIFETSKYLLYHNPRLH
jgi:phosphoglycerol transferase MdoB-like AlkP superfamily enzyme